MRRGADVNARDADGRPVLHAALGADPRISELLLDAGAAIDAPDQYGRTVLHWAVEAHDVDLVTRLVARGANVNVKDKSGHAPLYYTWGGATPDLAIADILRRHGAADR